MLNLTNSLHIMSNNIQLVNVFHNQFESEIFKYSNFLIEKTHIISTNSTSYNIHFNYKSHNKFFRKRKNYKNIKLNISSKNLLNLPIDFEKNIQSFSNSIILNKSKIMSIYFEKNEKIDYKYKCNDILIMLFINILSNYNIFSPYIIKKITEIFIFLCDSSIYFTTDEQIIKSNLFFTNTIKDYFYLNDTIYVMCGNQTNFFNQHLPELLLVSKPIFIDLFASNLQFLEKICFESANLIINNGLNISYEIVGKNKGNKIIEYVKNTLIKDDNNTYTQEYQISDNDGTFNTTTYKLVPNDNIENIYTKKIYNNTVKLINKNDDFIEEHRIFFAFKNKCNCEICSKFECLIDSKDCIYSIEQNITITLKIIITTDGPINIDDYKIFFDYSKYNNKSEMTRLFKKK